jgi:hypothetical protein
VAGRLQFGAVWGGYQDSSSTLLQQERSACVNWADACVAVLCRDVTCRAVLCCAVQPPRGVPHRAALLVVTHVLAVGSLALTQSDHSW